MRADQFSQCRDLLEPGANVLLFISGEVQGEDVRARIQSAKPLDAVSAARQSDLRIHIAADDPLDSIRKRLEPRTDDEGGGEVTLVLQLREGGEALLRLPGRFKVSPQIAGAIKAVPGVVQVETV